MSAKEAYRKPVIHIEKLPYELLGEVFHHATWVPYKIDPSDMVFSYLQSSESKELYWQYRTSLVTRRYFMRVCKSWYKIAALYLYQWLLLGRLESLPGLQAAVERQHSNDDKETLDKSGIPTNGWYTRRLDIAFRSDKTRRTALEVVENDTVSIINLLRALPNLEVLTVKHPFGVRWLDPSVSHTFCPALQIVNWYHEYDNISPETWDHFVTSHPNLTAVHLPYIQSYSTTTEPKIHNTVQTCSIGLRDTLPVHHLPSLKRLILSHSSFKKGLNRFANLASYASILSLTTIQLNCAHVLTSFNLYDEFFDFASSFALFQNLRRIDVVLPLWPTRWSSEPPPPLPSTVSVLGFRIASSKPPKSLVLLFLAWLGRFVREAKAPLAIQFLDSRTLKGILMHHSTLLHKGARNHILSSWLDPNGQLFKLELESS